MRNCDRRRKHWLLFLQIAALITSTVSNQEHLFQPASHNLKIQQQAVQQRGDENCETARSEIQLIKGEWGGVIHWNHQLKITQLIHRGIRWTRTTHTDLQRRGACEQMRGILQQSSAAECDFADGFLEGVLLLPWNVPPREIADTESLLRSGWTEVDGESHG